jgi:hypothetical protein
MQNKNDPWANFDGVREFYDSLTVEKEMLWIDDEKKRFAAYEYFINKPEKMLDFFNKHLKTQ